MTTTESTNNSSLTEDSSSNFITTKTVTEKSANVDHQRGDSLIIILSALVGLFGCGLFVTLVVFFLRQKRRRYRKREGDVEESRNSDERVNELVDNDRRAEEKPRKKSKADDSKKKEKQNKCKKNKNKTAKKDATKLYEDIDERTVSQYTDDHLYSEIKAEGEKTPNVRENRKTKDTEHSTIKEPAVGSRSNSLGREKASEKASVNMPKGAVILYSVVDKAKKSATKQDGQVKSNERTPGGSPAREEAQLYVNLSGQGTAETGQPRAEENAPEAETSQGVRTTPDMADRPNTAGDGSARPKPPIFSRSVSGPKDKAAISDVRCDAADKPTAASNKEEDTTKTLTNTNDISPYAEIDANVKDNSDNGTSSKGSTRIKHEAAAAYVENSSGKAKPSVATGELYSQVHKPKHKNSNKAVPDGQGTSQEEVSAQKMNAVPRMDGGGEGKTRNESASIASKKTLGKSKTKAVGRNEKDVEESPDKKQPKVSKTKKIGLSAKLMKKIKKQSPRKDKKADTNLYDTVNEEEIVEESFDDSSKPAAGETSEKENEVYSEVHEARLNLSGVNRSGLNPNGRDSTDFTVLVDNPEYLKV